MKKFIYLCGMLLLCLNVMAQFDPYDKNWDTVVNEDFSIPGRSWIHWSFKSSDGLWRAYPGHGVTHGKELMVYQFNQNHFNDNENFMELVSEYDTCHRIPINDYYLPSWMQTNHGGPGYPQNDSLFFFSGEIDYSNEYMDDYGKFQFGRFEIRCKLPIHPGAFPAFWLWSANDINPADKYYEEIDIFEYSWSFEDDNHNHHGNLNPHGAGNPYCFTTGFYYNDTTNHLYWQSSQARNFPMINDSLSHWHTFACEWLPEHIIWYCDGNIVNEYHNPNRIPRHSLTLKTNYAIDKYVLREPALGNPVVWKDGDEMTIDYIKVYQLNWDCSSSEVVTKQSELDSFDYGVKKSITITSSIEPVYIGNTDKVTFRATDFFEITGPFQVDSGGEMTVIMQQCSELP